MGCTQSVQAQKGKKLSPYKKNLVQMPIQIRLKMLRTNIQLKKMKLQGTLGRNVMQLQRMIKQSLNKRNKHLEYQKIEQSTLIKNQAHIYEVVLGYLKVLQQYKQFLKNAQLIKDLKLPIINIIYAKDAIQNNQLQQFCSIVLCKYPQLCQISKTPNENQGIIDDEIIKHHKNQRLPNSKMINSFVLQYCTQNQIQLDQINATGNNFHYQ